MFLAAAVQMTSTHDKPRNVSRAEELVNLAADRGARFVGLPENFTFMGADADKSKIAEALDGPTLSRMARLAKARNLTLLAGSILETGAPGNRFFNTSVLFGPDGARLGVYRKIHLFDVDIQDGARYRESEAVAPGKEVVTAQGELARFGMSVCYDLRFPELYRTLSKAGAQVLLVPAAFTLLTGMAHWETLLRARAIENLAFVIAPAQTGQHSEKRLTYGHAMVIDPWGQVLATAGSGEGVALAPVDLEVLDRVRRELPALSHRVLP
jgi:predicted amidohydrolase